MCVYGLPFIKKKQEADIFCLEAFQLLVETPPNPLEVQDTCRAPCSGTWPCSASCTPAGFQPAGRPISGPGLSVSVREGSGSWSTWWSPSSSPLPNPVLLPPLLGWFWSWLAAPSESAVHLVAAEEELQEAGFQLRDRLRSDSTRRDGAVCLSSTRRLSSPDDLRRSDKQTNQSAVEINLWSQTSAWRQPD